METESCCYRKLIISQVDFVLPNLNALNAVVKLVENFFRLYQNVAPTIGLLQWMVWLGQWRLGKLCEAGLGQVYTLTFARKT